ncbi:HD domain-containing protein [Cypionkella sp.]|uniref:HD domain-containing protein n=1 Tax=Cypionkella sp. TaxID=2811411 RepID=UPI0027284DB9|nr:HD domain-containing protein [Cypionkella sp.]MDO8985951.1 HD domain-containing protein [Cypionkella sp.]MDP2048140.1 HD domain-containing protein [Cypionkella sp.]
MREIIAVCRSEKRARDHVARVLDRYFWRIGDRTWRGKATNACLDRVAKELRKRATRNTAVVVHEIRSSAESRKPIIRIGARNAFSEEGVVPVSSHPAEVRETAARSQAARSSVAVVAVAALFHDLGKATVLFQAKLRRALNGGKPEADALRHDFFSAALWDQLFGGLGDAPLISALQALTPEQIDQACGAVQAPLLALFSAERAGKTTPLPFAFLKREGALAHLIGLLILTHHRLPSANSDHVTMLPERHFRTDSPLTTEDLCVAAGEPFWHEAWWLRALQTEAGRLTSDTPIASADIGLRAALMFADHYGSSQKKPLNDIPDHLGNTKPIEGQVFPADSLSCHVHRVYRYSRFAHELLYALRDRYPALDEAALPPAVALPEASDVARFAWQTEAARAARKLCSSREGGFFAAILAGTGSGKTRAAPTILANAAMGDRRAERRYFRMNLGLGLRVLATQSAQDYVRDLGFAARDISVMVGDPPLEFEPKDELQADGSESLIKLPEWLRVEHPETRIPQEGDEAEALWLAGLSLDTDRGLPAFLSRILEDQNSDAAGSKAAAKRFVQAPIMVGTVDHLMGVAAPTSPRFLLQSLRLMTSDLILDEVDQYDGEDLAAIARLVYQAGAAGRRVMAMSATLTPDIAEAFYLAYSKGWAEHARATGADPHINLLVTGDAPNSVCANGADEDITVLLHRCRAALLAGIAQAPTLRRGAVLPSCESWYEVVAQVEHGATRLHSETAVELEGLRVSVGLVRMTRIAHATALAAQLRSGDLGGRLRLMVCLHSQMPRLHRAYIEARLKRALTRKLHAPDYDPEANLLALCVEFGLFDRARALGARDIEILVVTTPVIETGSDVDFDWAILDPISTRAIVQTAGRVRRHRPATGRGANVLILGRSLIAMESGVLARPGVETECARETKVSATEALRIYDKRSFAALAGGVSFDVITAAPLLSEVLPFPLRDAEAEMRMKMLSTEPRAPLGKYLAHPNARWNLEMTRTRKFRRSDEREILYTQRRARAGEADWFVNLTPALRGSAWIAPMQLARPALATQCLFTDLTPLGWAALTGGGTDMTDSDLKELLRVSIPCFGDGLEPELSYTDFTGFTRGTEKDLFAPFGKYL